MSLPGAAARGLAAALLTAFVLAAAPVLAEPAFEVELEFLPVERFRIGSEETRFGTLEFVGGFEMRSPQRDFGQLSSMRFLSPGENFIGVADHGYWFFGTVERDGDDVPVGMADFAMQPMVDADGDLLLFDKHYADAEGLSLHDGIATVTFEREHRVQEFAIKPGAMGPPLRDLDFLIPRRELRYNQGIETVARAPEDSHLEGARIVVAERSIDTDGNLFAAILEGPEQGLFFVTRSDGFDVTDGVFLPDGDLLLLERRFSLPQGVAMRIRRIEGSAIRAGALVDGEILIEADMTHQIDNMESIDWWRRSDGALVLALMSDDNQSMLQRSLYLEFVLVGE
jgi:hypothetical protein